MNQEIEYRDPYSGVQYSKDQHDELVAPLLRVIETIPSVVRDEQGKVKLGEPIIADLLGSYPMTIVRFLPSIVLTLQLQDDGGKPYVIGKLKKFHELRRAENGDIISSANETIELGPLYPQELDHLPELVAKLGQVEVPDILTDTLVAMGRAV